MVAPTQHAVSQVTAQMHLAYRVCLQIWSSERDAKDNTLGQSHCTEEKRERIFHRGQILALLQA